VTGKLELVLEPVEVVPTLVSVLENVRLTARSKDIELTSRVEPLAGLVWGDAGRLEQVFANLLDNALKFTRSGGQVQVELKRNGDRVVITICDTGVGIAPELLPYIFDRFRQGDGSTTRTYGGLGLGLAIVRHLVEAMHGKIIAQSAGVGQGATFTITLPSIAADQTDIRRTDQDEANLP
jgi:signal transduction histidine kinase